VTDATDVVFETAINALRTDAACVAALGGRVFDVPGSEKIETPYAYLGPVRMQFERLQTCAEAWRFTFRVYVVSETHNRRAAWRAAWAVARALHQKMFDCPPGFAFAEEWNASQAGDIIDPTRIKECFVDVTAVVAVTSADGA
jgi:hypothetical protein